jgi:hypothetical protein
MGEGQGKREEEEGQVKRTDSVAEGAKRGVGGGGAECGIARELNYGENNN